MPTDDPSTPRVLAISGSTRHRSTNTALCRTAAALAIDGVTVECGPDVADLPHFHPDDDHDPLPAAVAKLRAAVAAADGVLFCTPEYAGTLPGSFKNLLDWLVGGTEINEKRVAWVNASLDGQRGQGAHDTLATVMRYVNADVVTAACRHVPVAHDQVTPDGVVADPATRAQLADVVTALLAPRP